MRYMPYFFIIYFVIFLFPAELRSETLADQHANHETLPVFQFKMVTSGKNIDTKTIGRCSSDKNFPDKEKCIGRDSNISGVNSIIPPAYFFYKKRLTQMVFVFRNKNNNFNTIFSAFSEKYGPPCEKTIQKWQNRLGNTLDNPTAKWCFKTGEMTMQALSSNVMSGYVNYVDEYQPPEPKPQINF